MVRKKLKICKYNQIDEATIRIVISKIANPRQQILTGEILRICIKMATYSQICEAINEFNSLKTKLSSMRCECWGVYRLDAYETEECVQGTDYQYVKDYATEKECLGYVERLISLGNKGESYYNYVVVPITKNGFGCIYIGNKDVSRHFRNYKGPCKVMMSTCDNPVRWFEAKELRPGYEDVEYAEVHIIEQKPEDWIDEDYDKYSLVPIWPN